MKTAVIFIPVRMEITAVLNFLRKCIKLHFYSLGIKFEKETASAESLLQVLRELCSLPEDEIGHELHCVELVFKLWRLLLQYIHSDQSAVAHRTVNDSKEQRLNALVSFVHAHYSEPITVEDMAKHISISRTECFRCFQRILQKTPVEYLTEYRLSMAAAMLVNTGRTVADIAESCGFQSASYFGKLFRERYKKHPKHIRKIPTSEYLCFDGKRVPRNRAPLLYILLMANF